MKKTFKCTNLDISNNCKKDVFYFLRSDFLGMFSRWVVSQSPYDTPDIQKPLQAFSIYINIIFKEDLPVKFTYQELFDFISEKELEKIPEILELNNRKNGREGMGFTSRYDKPAPDDDFIDLGALSRNICTSLIRDYITQS